MNIMSTLNGLFKEQYADKLMTLVPDGVKLLKMIKFIESSKELGRFYHQPVLLAQEHGVTYAAANGDAFTLNAAIAARLQDAQVEGSQMLLRSAISYEAAVRASNDKKAFVKSTSLLVENMLNSISKRLEVSLLYGQTSLASSVVSVNQSATTSQLQIPAASWAPGIWSGSENAVLVAYNGTSRLNASDTAGYTVSSVDLVNRYVNVSASSADITAIDAATGSIDLHFLSAVQGTGGGKTFHEFAGMDKIISNSGSLFNINASTYALWKGNSYSAGGASLSLTKILNAVAFAVERGLDEDVICLLSAKTWANIASDQAALRIYDQSYKPSKLENGSSEFVFNGQNGRIEIHTSIYVKEGEAFIFPLKRFKRIGAIEVTFKMPGRSQQEDFFAELQNQAGYELRCYTDQALFCDSPAKCVKISSIVNS